MNKFNQIFIGLFLSFALSVSFAFADGKTSKRIRRAQKPVEIKVIPWGQNQAAVDAAKSRAERSQAVQKQLKGTRYRLLEFNYLENEDKSKPTQIPTQFRAVFYDYTNDRTIAAEGDFAGKQEITAREIVYQPIPNDEEFAEAVGILQGNKNFGESLQKRIY